MKMTEGILEDYRELTAKYITVSKQLVQAAGHRVALAPRSRHYVRNRRMDVEVEPLEESNVRKGSLQWGRCHLTEWVQAGKDFTAPWVRRFA